MYMPNLERFQKRIYFLFAAQLSLLLPAPSWRPLSDLIRSNDASTSFMVLS